MVRSLTPRHGRHGRIATGGRLTVALRLDRSGDRRAWRRIDAHEAHHGGPLGRPRPCRRRLQWRQLWCQPGGVGRRRICTRRIRWRVGGGIRWQSPIGPLRFEIGFPFNPREDERKSVFDFGIGSFF